MKNKKQILVFTPTLGESKTLSRTVESVRNISKGICPNSPSETMMRLLIWGLSAKASFNSVS